VSDREPVDEVSFFDRAWARVQNQSGASDTSRPPPDTPGGGGPQQSLFGPSQQVTSSSPLRGSFHYLLGTLVREVLFTGGALVLLGVAAWVWRQRRDEEEAEEDEPEELLELEGHVSSRARPAPWTQEGTSEFEVVTLYLRMLSLLEREGLERHRAETPYEFVRRGAGRFEGVGPLSNLFVRARYGPGQIDEGQTAEARHLLARVEQALR
jgi:hypothetical protein